MIVSNHTDWDRSKVNLPLLAKRVPDSPNSTEISDSYRTDRHAYYFNSKESVID